MNTIKLPAYSFRESIQLAAQPLALILCAALGSRTGRWVFGASEDAWTNAYLFGMALAVVFIFMVNRKSIVEKTFPKQFPLWIFLATIFSSFLLCDLFKAI